MYSSPGKVIHWSIETVDLPVDYPGFNSFKPDIIFF